MDIPEFEGRMQPDEFIDWLNTVDQVFQLQRYKVKLAAIKLKKLASLWWENLKKK